ncbi:MAG: glycosyltransferase [Synechococcales bacterium]|nr:glycosyltransferase [Synechococcales bacterium]
MPISAPTAMSIALPFLSVIIPIYNGEADIPDLVSCLWRQTYPAAQVEYLLVDNNSGDRTFSLLQAFAAKSQAQGITLKPLQEATIQSSYAARNAGIRAAQGPVLVFTDADCRPHPDWLEHLIKPLADPAVGLVAGEVRAFPSRNLLETYADRQATLSQTHTLAHPFRPYGQTANLAVRRQVLLQAGLFRPYLTTGGDADLCWRVLATEQWKIAFAETALVHHRHRSTLAELHRQWRRYGQSNRYLHELHGVVLTRELTPQDYLHRWGRWLLKEIPKGLLATMQGKGDPVSFVETPLSLLCTRARSQGQRQARLPEKAHEIDWLPDGLE